MRLRHFLGAVAAGVWSKDRRPLIDQFREIFCQEPSCDDPYLNSLCRQVWTGSRERPWRGELAEHDSYPSNLNSEHGEGI